jgi:hypothetical protein
MVATFSRMQCESEIGVALRSEARQGICSANHSRKNVPSEIYRAPDALRFSGLRGNHPIAE